MKKNRFHGNYFFIVILEMVISSTKNDYENFSTWSSLLMKLRLIKINRHV